MRRAVVSEKAHKAVGPYSSAVWEGDLLFLSGQTPIDPATQRLVEGDIGVQTARAFDNLEAVLQDAGLSLDHVVKCNVYLTTMKNFAAMNDVYRTRFTPPYPARTTVAVAELPLGARVEVEMVARKA